MPEVATPAPDPLEMLATLFERPDEAYLGRVNDLVESLGGPHPVAGRQLTDFVGRLEGLTGAELRELHAQSFDCGEDPRPSTVQVLGRLKFVEPDIRPGYVARVVVPTLERDLSRLDEQRNPFSHLLKATLAVALPVARSLLGLPQAEP